jgi:hypothetical protein
MELTDLEKEVLLLCADYDVGLWEVIRIANGASYSKHHVVSVEVRRKTIEIIRDLLQKGLIQPGSPSAPEFQALFPPSDKVIDFIEQEWDKLGRTPNLGDIIWFTATEVGEQFAQQILASRNDNTSAN